MDSPADRVVHRREQALEFRTKAAKEPGGSMFKDQLVDLAKRCDRLATEVENDCYRR